MVAGPATPCAPLKMSPPRPNMVGREEAGSIWEVKMFRLSNRPLFVVCAIAATLALAVSDANARAGRGGSFGSRGSQTFSAPPSTATSPGARPIERSMAQPGQPGGLAQRQPSTSPFGGGFFGRPGFHGRIVRRFPRRWLVRDAVRPWPHGWTWRFRLNPRPHSSGRPRRHCRAPVVGMVAAPQSAGACERPRLARVCFWFVHPPIHGLWPWRGW